MWRSNKSISTTEGSRHASSNVTVTSISSGMMTVANSETMLAVVISTWIGWDIDTNRDLHHTSITAKLTIPSTMCVLSNYQVSKHVIICESIMNHFLLMHKYDMFPCVCLRITLSRPQCHVASRSTILETPIQFGSDRGRWSMWVCVGGGVLVFDQREWEEFPRLCVCVSVLLRKLQRTQTLRDDSRVLTRSVCCCGYLYVVSRGEERRGGTPLALSSGGVSVWRLALAASGHPHIPYTGAHKLSPLRTDYESLAEKIDTPIEAPIIGCCW